MSVEPALTSDVIGLTKAAPFSRRGFMTASAAVTAGYTLAAGPVRAEVITTDTNGLNAGDAKIKVADGEMPAYFARPASASNPPVILVAMEIFGLHQYIKDVTRRLAKLGALAVAPDYYFRKGTDLTKIADIKELLPIVNAKPDAELLTDLDATVAWAKSQGGDTSRLGIVGFCRGGQVLGRDRSQSCRGDQELCTGVTEHRTDRAGGSVGADGEAQQGLGAIGRNAPAHHGRAASGESRA